MNSKITIPVLNKMKQAGEKITMLTAYDASFSRLLESAGVEIILVGDSLGMVVQGNETTLSVTVDEVIYHCKLVSNVAKKSLIIADMPFMSYANEALALENAARLIREAGAMMVKLEGGAEQVKIVQALNRCNIPVCAHLGLQPQSVHKLGGYLVQGRDESVAQQMISDARLLEEAGADLLVLECVPTDLAETISNKLDIPVIGIGAGASCDGQVLVLYDVLGITPEPTPKFTHNFMHGADSIEDALSQYVIAVKKQTFPTLEHSF